MPFLCVLKPHLLGIRPQLIGQCFLCKIKVKLKKSHQRNHVDIYSTWNSTLSPENIQLPEKLTCAFFRNTSIHIHTVRSTTKVKVNHKNLTFKLETLYNFHFQKIQFWGFLHLIQPFIYQNTPRNKHLFQ